MGSQAAVARAVSGSGSHAASVCVVAFVVTVVHVRGLRVRLCVHASRSLAVLVRFVHGRAVTVDSVALHTSQQLDSVLLNGRFCSVCGS